MNNAIVLTCYDRTQSQYDLTLDTLDSAIKQDIPVDIYLIDNGSTYEPWVGKIVPGMSGEILRHPRNESPIKLGNLYAAKLFALGYEHILGMPNDVVLPPNLYRKLLERPEQMVAPNMDGQNPPGIMETVERIHGDLHMAVMLMRKSAYDTLMAKDGYLFDEGMFMYASDCDLKLRIAEAGISTSQLDIQCWHYGGASHRLAPDAHLVHEQADRDRTYFTRKWGFSIGSLEYNERISKL